MLAQVFLLMHGYYLIRLVRETLILVEGSPEVRSYANGAIALTLIFVIPVYKLLFDYLKHGGDKSAVLRWVGSFFVANLLDLRLPGLARHSGRRAVLHLGRDLQRHGGGAVLGVRSRPAQHQDRPAAVRRHHGRRRPRRADRQPGRRDACTRSSASPT
jgi:hypothetical protein